MGIVKERKKESFKNCYPSITETLLKAAYQRLNTMGGRSLDLTKIRQSITKQINTVRSSWRAVLPKVVTIYYVKGPVYSNKL